jgi:hypothetical protein
MDPLAGWKRRSAPRHLIVGLPAPGAEVPGGDKFYSPRLLRTDRSAAARLSRLRRAFTERYPFDAPTLRETVELDASPRSGLRQP